MLQNLNNNYYYLLDERPYTIFFYEEGNLFDHHRSHDAIAKVFRHSMTPLLAAQPVKTLLSFF